MSTPFRERNPVKVGAASLAVLIAVMVLAFKAGDLPLIGGGDTYHASFSDASGIKANDEVRIAGVRVGKVIGVDLNGNKVDVSFKVDTPSHFGSETSAQIKVKTLLGAMYLGLQPKGAGQLKEGATIPLSRTSSAYDVVQAFSGLADRAERIDTKRLATSIDTIADLTKDTPAAFQGTLRGLSRLSETVASRNDQINTLLKNLHTVSGTLAARDEDIVSLMKNSDTLLRALVARRTRCTGCWCPRASSDRADTAREAVPRRPQAGTEQPPRCGEPAAEEPEQPRREPAADGALLPGLRQHAG